MTQQTMTDQAAGEQAAAERKSAWVFIEQADGRIADVSLELLGKARELAGQAATTWSACCAGTTWTSWRRR